MIEVLVLHVGTYAAIELGVMLVENVRIGGGVLPIPEGGDAVGAL